MTKKTTAPTAAQTGCCVARDTRIGHAGGKPPAAEQALASRDRALASPLTRDPSEDPAERRQPQAGGRGERSLAVAPDSYDAEARTVEVILSSGAPVRRYWFTEELEISETAIELARVTGGVCPLLDTHNQYQLDGVIGRVLSARIEDGKLIGTVQFADTVAGRDIEARVASGELRSISIGYRVTRWQMTEADDTGHETWRAVAWELLEASLVPVPADPNAVVRSAPGIPAHGNQEEEDDMRRNLPGGAAAAAATAPAASAAPAAATTEPARSEPAAVAPAATTPAVEPVRAAPAAVTASVVLTAARNAGLDQAAQTELLDRHAETPLTRDALMAEIGSRFAERDTPAQTPNRVTVTRDEGDTMRRGMEDFLLHRLSPRQELTELGRGFRGMSLLRLAEEHLTASGVSCRGMVPMEIAERSLHTSSDFANLVGNALNRRLRAAYEENQPSYRRWARRAPNAPDFKSIDVVQMSAMPDLEKTNEAGEFKYGTASDGKVSYSLVTYGKVIGFTRQLIVNDDLRALERVTMGFANAATRLENRTVYKQIDTNPTMPDGTALFHADHGNLGTGVINATNLGAGRAKMRLQKGLQSEELNLAPSYLIVPATIEQLAYQYTSSQFVPAKSSDTNEFRAGGRTALDPVVEAVLDATDTAAWYLAADSGQVDTVEYCYLDGAEGVQMSNRVGFTVDGVEFKAVLDFAAAVIDHRGLFKSSGV